MRFYSLLLGVLFLSASCSKIYHLADTTSVPYKIEHTSPIVPDAAITQLINPYKQQLDAAMNVVVGNCSVELTKAKPESTLGNWIADALHQQAENYRGAPVDFALQNYGGIRVPSIGVGVVTKGGIFELMPFENRIVVLELRGDMVQRLLSHIAGKGGWPISRTARYVIENGQATAIFIDDKALDLSKTYQVAIPDYIANGGDQCDFLKDQKRVVYQNLIRDALLEFLTKNPTMEAALDGRVEIK